MAVTTPPTIRQRIAYFKGLREEGFNSHEAVAIGREESHLEKGDKQGWSAFYATYPDHEFAEIEAGSAA